MLILKAYSCEIDLWVTLDDFIVKKRNLEGKCVLIWNRLSKNEMCCAEDNYIYKWVKISKT